MLNRRLSPLDHVLAGVNNALRVVAAPAGVSPRPYPASQIEDGPLDAGQKRHAAGLMRVNHAGEVAAQGLYQGHAAMAKDARIEAKMQHAAAEEFDHLAWCERRLAELGASPSRLSPVWYTGSFLIGAASSVFGDRWGLGFIAETERQVCEHLATHLEHLPDEDARSRAIVEQMHEEEAVHGAEAIAAGAADLPAPLKRLMRLTARVMTTTAYRV